MRVPTDKSELLERGGRVDLTAFCRKENARLVGMLTLYVGDRAAAEDIAQEALARAWHRWKKVKELDDPSAWTRRVAINLANSRFRRMRSEQRAYSLSGSRPDPIDAQDLTDAHAIRQAVAALPKRQKAALVLRYYLDLPYAEVAHVMGIPESTARTHVRRAIATLRGTEGFERLTEVADVS